MSLSALGNNGSSQVPIRVVRILGRLNIGGPAKHVIALTSGLDWNHYQTTLVVGREEPGEGNLLAEAEAAGVRPIVEPSLGRTIDPARDVVALGRLIRMFRRLRPHIVETHTAKAGFLGRIAARTCRVPVVVHMFHGNVFQGYFSPAVSRTFLQLERWLAGTTDAIVAVSPQQREELLEYAIGRPEQIRVIRLALRPEDFSVPEESGRRLREELGIPVGVPVVGLVARLAPIKNVPLFIEAALRVRAELPDAHFLVVGDGELRSDLGDRARALGLERRVVFAGWRSDMPAVYRSMDVLALTSRNEGTPVSLIEGLASGVPMVSTRVGGVPDVLDDGETGILVEPDEPQTLAESILRLLSDKKLRERLTRNGRTAVQRYGRDRLMSDVDELYRDLLFKKRVPPFSQSH